MNDFEKEIKERRSQRIASIVGNFTKGENDVLSKDDFEGLKKENEVFTPDNILNYRSDLQKALDGEEITQDDFEKGIQEISGLQAIKVENGLNQPKTFFLKPLEKAETESTDEDQWDTTKNMKKQKGSETVEKKSKDKKTNGDDEEDLENGEVIEASDEEIDDLEKSHTTDYEEEDDGDENTEDDE